MDMLSWSNLNSSVSIRDTTKKFYNKYLNKIVIYCPGARVAQDKRSLINIDDVIAARIARINYLRSYNRWQPAQRIEDWRRDQLMELTNIKSTASQMPIKIRIEEPDVSFYSDDMNQLYDLAIRMGSDRLREVFRPANSGAVDILNRGEIITKSDPEFQYKIMLKEIWNLDKATKTSLLDYLYNLGDDEVCLTKSIVKNLGSVDRTWFPGGYFYAKDEKITTFVNLIAPGIVAGIFKLSKLDQ